MATKAKRDIATGHYYRLMIEHTKAVLADIKRVVPDDDATQSYELASFDWFQGWKGMVDSGTYTTCYKPDGYDVFGNRMAQFIRDARQDLQVPKLPFVIGVLELGGPVKEYGPDQHRHKSTHRSFRLAMAAPTQLPEFMRDVAAVLID